MRVLPIDERTIVERLADLEDFAVTVGAECRRFEAEHQRESQPAGAGGSLGHPHPPILDGELLAATRASLIVEIEEDHAILHQVPLGHWHGTVVVLGWRGCLRGSERRL